MSKSEIVLSISPDGERVKAIYQDRLKPVFAVLGNASTERASHVEPDDNSDWIADCSPIGGPALGPFFRREDALRAEVQFINTKGLSWVTKPEQASLGANHA